MLAILSLTVSFFAPAPPNARLPDVGVFSGGHSRTELWNNAEAHSALRQYG